MGVLELIIDALLQAVFGLLLSRNNIGLAVLALIALVLLFLFLRRERNKETNTRSPIGVWQRHRIAFAVCGLGVAVVLALLSVKGKGIGEPVTRSSTPVAIVSDQPTVTAVVLPETPFVVTQPSMVEGRSGIETGCFDRSFWRIYGRNLSSDVPCLDDFVKTCGFYVDNSKIKVVVHPSQRSERNCALYAPLDSNDVTVDFDIRVKDLQIQDENGWVRLTIGVIVNIPSQWPSGKFAHFELATYPYVAVGDWYDNYSEASMNIDELITGSLDVSGYLLTVDVRQGEDSVVREENLPIPGSAGYALYIGYRAEMGAEFTSEISINMKDNVQK